MHMGTIGTIAAIIGVVVAAFTGSAIARISGFGSQSWLMLAFAFGILLMSQGSVLNLQQQVRELKESLAKSQA